MKILIILLLSCIPAFGQVSTTIPAATSTSQGVVQPGKTMSVSNGVLDCISNTSATWNASTGQLVVSGIPVTNLTLQSATFNGVPAPGDGTYLVTFTGGTEGYLAYVPPTGTAPVGKTYTVTVPTTNGTTWTVVAGLILSSGQQATAVAISPHTGPPVTTDWFYYVPPQIQVDSANAVYIGVHNGTPAPITNAKILVTVK